MLGEVCRDDRSPSCATADEPQGFLELIPPRHGGYLLRQDFLEASSLEIADLGIQASLLIW